MKISILGAGLAGLSCSYHIGHENCQIFERSKQSMGHAGGYTKFGVEWDFGPHVSFTRDEYVRELFTKSVSGEVLEFDAQIGNYFYGEWLDHPVQFHLGQLNDPLRTQAFNDFISSQEKTWSGNPKDYREWLVQSFGKTITEEFFERYTRKYWTKPTLELATDWIGPRVQKATIEDIKRGFLNQQPKEGNYISRIRYPTYGGFKSFLKILTENANVKTQHEVVKIDFQNRSMVFANGHIEPFETLISTIPLPELVRLSDAPDDVKAAGRKLACSSVALVNITVPRPLDPPYHWFYIYDSEMISSRVSFMSNFSLQRNSISRGALQVEVYYSASNPLTLTKADLHDRVIGELRQIGLIDEVESVHSSNQIWGNVIFDRSRLEAQETILAWMEGQGLCREADDLLPTTDWTQRDKNVSVGKIVLAGRFAQWKYFWTDDCVLRGADISARLD